MCSHMSAPLCSHLCIIVIIITTTSLASFCPPPHCLGSLAGIIFCCMVFVCFWLVSLSFSCLSLCIVSFLLSSLYIFLACFLPLRLVPSFFSLCRASFFNLIIYNMCFFLVCFSSFLSFFICVILSFFLPLFFLSLCHSFIFLSAVLSFYFLKLQLENGLKPFADISQGGPWHYAIPTWATR